MGPLVNTLTRCHVALDQARSFRERALDAYHRDEVRHGDDLMAQSEIWMLQAAKPLLQVAVLRGERPA